MLNFAVAFFKAVSLLLTLLGVTWFAMHFPYTTCAICSIIAGTFLVLWGLCK